MNLFRNSSAAAALAAITLSQCVSAAAAAAGDVVTRYVLAYSGPATVWLIQRGTQRLAPKNGLALQLSDCITLETATPGSQTATMTVVVDGREIAVSHDKPHYCVTATQTQNPVVAAITRSFASLAGVFHDAESDYNTQSTTSAVSRGGPFTPHLTIPILGQDDQRLVAGSRALALAWAPGTGPYLVTVIKTGSTQPLLKGTATVNRIQLESATFAPGTYEVEITDAAHLAGRKHFTVVPESDLPAPSADIAAILADPATPPDLRVAFDAARLMNDPSDTWRLEAYQRVVGHQASALAGRLIYQLENDG